MDQLMHVILTIDKVHTTTQRALDCELGLGGLNQVYGPNHLTIIPCKLYGSAPFLLGDDGLVC